MHSGHIEGANTHFAGDIQIKLILVQISVFADVEFVLIDFFVTEVLAGGSYHLCFNHLLLLLKD